MIKPTMGHIAIKIEASPETFSNGLFRPDQAKEIQDTAIVVAVSEGVRTPKGKVVPHGVEVGNKILLAVKFAGTEIKHEGETIVIVPIREVAAVLA